MNGSTLDAENKTRKNSLLTERIVHETFHGIHACAFQFAMDARHGGGAGGFGSSSV